MKQKHKALGDNIFFLRLTLKPKEQRDPGQPLFRSDQEIEATKIYLKYNGDTREYFIAKANKGLWTSVDEAIEKPLVDILYYNFTTENISHEEFFMEML